MSAHFHDVFIVFYDNHGVAQVAQRQQHFDEPFGIFGMQPYAGLVKDVHGSHQTLPREVARLMRCDSPPDNEAEFLLSVK
jgi:hypothetical protein